MGSCAPAVPRHRRSARWKWSKISAGGDELLERHAPECAAEDSTQAPHNLPRRQARSGAEVGRLEAAAMANGCDEAGGRVSLSEYPGYRLRLGVHLFLYSCIQRWGANSLQYKFLPLQYKSQIYSQKLVNTSQIGIPTCKLYGYL